MAPGSHVSDCPFLSKVCFTWLFFFFCFIIFLSPQYPLWYQPHLKNTNPLFLAKPLPLNLQSVQTPFLRQLPPLDCFLHQPPPKNRFFSKHQKYSSFSSLTPSYLLKITKFIVKISQFEFLVMTEENIFVYTLFL